MAKDPDIFRGNNNGMGKMCIYVDIIKHILRQSICNFSGLTFYFGIFELVCSE